MYRSASSTTLSGIGIWTLRVTWGSGVVGGGNFISQFISRLVILMANLPAHAAKTAMQTSSHHSARLHHSTGTYDGRQPGNPHWTRSVSLYGMMPANERKTDMRVPVVETGRLTGRGVGSV